MDNKIQFDRGVDKKNVFPVNSRRSNYIIKLAPIFILFAIVLFFMLIVFLTVCNGETCLLALIFPFVIGIPLAILIPVYLITAVINFGSLDKFDVLMFRILEAVLGTIILFFLTVYVLDKI